MALQVLQPDEAPAVSSVVKRLILNPLCDCNTSVAHDS